MNYAFSCAVSVAFCKSEYCLGFFLLAVSSLIKHNISTQMKSAYSKREQDDQGKTIQESTVTPASAGRVAGWGRQTRDGDNNITVSADRLVDIRQRQGDESGHKGQQTDISRGQGWAWAYA